MSCFNIQDSRFLFKYSTIPGEVPTIAPSDDHTDGTWSPTDLYVGEFFLNSVDNAMWIRTSIGIVPITSGTTTINTTSFVNKSGDTMTGQLNVPSLSATTITGDTITSPHFEGVFYGDGSNLTGITASVFTGGTVAGLTTFQSDVDMCGVILSAATIATCGGILTINADVDILGSVSATTFYGDGSNLTNLPYFSGTTLDEVLSNGDTSTNGAITLTNGDITLTNGIFFGDGSGLTNLPLTTAPTWEDVLAQGNSSGAYDVRMGGGTYLYSDNGNSYLSMDGEGVGDEITMGNLTTRFNLNTNTIDVSGDINVFSGLTYDIDYSTNFTPRSLVDKAYVDNAISGATPASTLTEVLSNGNTTSGEDIVITSGDSLNFSGYSMFVTGSPTNPPDTRLVITSLGDNPTNSINLYNGLEGIRMVATDYVGDDVKSDFFLTSYGANFEIQDNDWDGTGKSQRNTTYFQPNNTLFSNQNLTDNLESKFHQILDNQYQTTELLLTDGLKFAKIFATNQNPNGEYTLQHQVDGATTSTLITQTSEVIEVSATSGITYDIDYSANYTNRSLVDKEYVDNLVGANDTLSEVLTNGNNTGSNDIILDDNGSGFTQSIKANNNIFNSQIGYEDIGGTTYAPLMKTEFNFNTNYIRVEDSETRIKNLTLNPAITDGYGEVVVNSNSIQSFVQDNISGDFTSIFSSPSLITVSGNDLIFGGIQYYQDYSPNYTNRSLVDKEYVDNLVGANNTLDEVLTNGNSTGANDIIFNEGQSIRHSGSTNENLRIDFSKDTPNDDIKQVIIKGESNGGYGFVGVENSLGLETKVRLQTRNGSGWGADLFMIESDNNITMSTNDGNDFTIFDFIPGAITITNPSTTNGTPGLQYDDDYSATFTNRTLVDKEYVDNKTGALVDDNGIQHDEIRASIANGTGIYVDEIGTPNFSKVDVGLSPGGVLNQNGINGYTGTTFTNAEIVSRYTEEGTPGTTGYKKLEDNLYLQTKQITYSEDTGYGVDDKLNVNEYVINHFFNDYTGTLDLFYEGFEQEAITDYDVEVYIKNNDTFAPQRQYMVWKMKRTCLYNNSNQSLDISPIDTQKYDYNLNPAYDSWDVTRQTSAFGDFWRLTWNFGNNYDFSVTIKIKQTTKKY